jgi:hypothetical protein
VKFSGCSQASCSASSPEPYRGCSRAVTGPEVGCRYRPRVDLDVVRREVPYHVRTTPPLLSTHEAFLTAGVALAAIALVTWISWSPVLRLLGVGS